MRKIAWSDDLSVGIEEIDQDHKQLVKALNGLFAACAAGEPFAVIQETLSRVREHTRAHFVHEEDVMTKVGFPGMDDHHRLHGDLISELDDVVETFEKSATQTIGDESLQFLEDWLLHHILIEDKKIGQHIGAI